MSSHARFVAAVGGIVACWVLVQTSLVSAQGRRFPQPQMQFPQLETKGTVEGMVMPNVIKINTDAKQAWFLKISPEAKLEITGTAKADVLAPGQYIKFVANVNQRTARVEEKVSKLTLFAPSIKDQVGAIPEQEAASALAAATAAAKNPGAGANPGGFGANAGFGASPAAGKAAAKGRALGTDSFEVKGRISSIKAGKVTLYVPNQYFKSTLKIELAEAPEISVEMEGTAAQCPLIARQGDKVEARGRQVAENGGEIHELKVTLTEPLSAESQKKTPRGKTAAGARSKKPEDSEEPAEEKQPKGETEKPGHKAHPKTATKGESKDDQAEPDADAPAKAKKPAGTKPAAKKPAKPAEKDDQPAPEKEPAGEDSKEPAKEEK